MLAQSSLRKEQIAHASREQHLRSRDPAMTPTATIRAVKDNMASTDDEDISYLSGHLQIGATACWKLFEKSSNSSILETTTGGVVCTNLQRKTLLREYGRFRVWCGNLGVHQGGHASLDWRLKDSKTIRHQVGEIFQTLEDDLRHCVELLMEERPPYEQEDRSNDSSSESEYATESELQIRIDAVKIAVKALYRLSSTICNQNPRRLALARIQNYRPRDASDRDLLELSGEYDEQFIDELFVDFRKPRPGRSRIDRRSNGLSLDKQLKERCLEATAIRRKQLAFNRVHSRELAARHQSTEDKDEGAGDDDVSGSTHSDTKGASHTGLTLATLAQADALFATSPVSTVLDDDGLETRFPGPPAHVDLFKCPYCFVVCHPEDDSRSRWRRHIREDLWSYMCTYSDCTDDIPLFGTRREWVVHEETIHRQSWTCKIHLDQVFATQAAFEAHLHARCGKLGETEFAKRTAQAANIVQDRRTHCPFCLVAVAELTGHGERFQKHLASHLEVISLACLRTNIYPGEEDHDNIGASNSIHSSLHATPHDRPFSDAREDLSRMVTAERRLKSFDTSYGERIIDFDAHEDHKHGSVRRQEEPKQFPLATEGLIREHKRLRTQYTTMGSRSSKEGGRKSSWKWMLGGNDDDDKDKKHSKDDRKGSEDKGGKLTKPQSSVPSLLPGSDSCQVKIDGSDLAPYSDGAYADAPWLSSQNVPKTVKATNEGQIKIYNEVYEPQDLVPAAFENYDFSSLAYRQLPPMDELDESLVEPEPEPEIEPDSEYEPDPAPATRRSRSRKQQSPTATQNLSSHRVNKLPSIRNTTIAPSTIQDIPRAFLCPLAPYGCLSAFNAMNEWKRHALTQHFRLGFWRCDQCLDSPERPSDFNRKDLFVQHVRRMHPVNAAPTMGGSKKTARTHGRVGRVATVEAALNKIAARCYQRTLLAPVKCCCVFCEERFEGEGAIESRLQHMGRHMESRRKDGLDPVAVPDWREDTDLESWLLLHEKIVRGRGGLECLR